MKDSTLVLVGVLLLMVIFAMAWFGPPKQDVKEAAGGLGFGAKHILSAGIGSFK